MKTITTMEAAEAGLTIVRSGMYYYVACPLPSGFDYSSPACHNLMLEQFEPKFETKEEEKVGEGYCVFVLHDWQGNCGLPDTRYIVRCHYSHNDGCQDWTWYGAVKLS